MPRCQPGNSLELTLASGAPFHMSANLLSIKHDFNLDKDIKENLLFVYFIFVVSEICINKQESDSTV